ncbi:SDR family NAD(P)-dependent oxidoreductase [Nonomuraea roseoviolacea]|uniref:NAD(P)-dependent dehydrogenase (Short-subunit alcohol dehydrogenase family) n=1 Tax=Nonomuraea roseoviolacea subsp. carminata TaxID=160689 RepID=A0ABT1KCN9_9ACTN|nr:SDR family NAD(P)-dependent oxidoreductase [Nonomuraea roseoviolacea]MCP2351780.1 NAD(P)-dependent dehydrogenase (short-subunit alcohol dehydrogenase family) [Nonomuraea roseoviolacea subsp. carminata]
MSKVWFVTGSSRGLGRQFVQAALSRGDRVAATARTTTSLDDLAAAYGDQVLPLAMDVTDKSAVGEAVKRAVEHFGRLDVIVNNAGYAQIGAIEELTEHELREQMETNLFGAVWVIQAVLPHLREQRSGHIIQLSSAAGLIALPLGGAYHASKWALEGLNEALAGEVADFGVKVTIIEPGGFATRDGKNPNPLDNGHVAAPDPAYDPLRQRLGAIAGKQPAGDPSAAAQALLKLVDSDNPPLRVLFGQGFQSMIQQAYADRLKTWADWQDLSAQAQGRADLQAAL